MLVFAEHIINRMLLADVKVPDEMAAGAWALFSHAGALGVSFFFMLSGFVLAYSARPGGSRWGFWRRRWAKIYPLHVVTAVAAAVMLVILDQPVTVWQGAANLTLTQAWVPLPAIHDSLNPVSWSLSCEMFFYLCFPFIHDLVRRQSTGRLYGAAAILAVVVVIRTVALIGADRELAKWLAYLLPAARLSGFTIGIILAVLVLRGDWKGPRLAWSLPLLLTVYGGAIVTPYPVHLHALTVVPVACVIASAACADARGQAAFWSRPTLVYLGEVSFAFYLIHYLVLMIAVAAGVFPAPLAPTRAFFAGLGIFTLSLALAVVLHHGVEKPLNRLLSGRNVRRQPT